ncbi:M50 family metallopeptidase [Acaryochloris thomasi]|uniref:M50 family metallopeptidase n=1 Tax=Acaryochloris thomasi TaxID=2929456 RepID=UPI001313F2A3|nr:M50 family metallopeptidase [Acaryochloris thomasi]
MGLVSLSIPSPGLVIIGVIYATFFSLIQWFILRQRFKPAWCWNIIGPIAFAAGFLIGGLICAAIYRDMEQSHSISALMGSLTGGLIYGAITSLGLRQISKQKYIPPQLKRKSKRDKFLGSSSQSQRQSAYDTPPGSNSRRWRLLPCFFSLLLMAVWYTILPPLSSSGTSVDPLLLLVFYVTYSYVSVLIHELGHFFLGWLNGAELDRFAVGKFIWVRTSQGMKFHRMRRRFVAGFVGISPRSMHCLRRKLLFLMAGGPIASFLLFLIGVIPLFLPELMNRYHLIWWFTLISMSNFYIAVFNLIPRRSGYITTDGRKILDLLQNNLQGQRSLAFHRFHINLKQGIRPRDIDPNIIKPLLAVPETSMAHISSLLIAYHMTLDQGELQQAGDYLDQILSMAIYFPELMRASLLLEGTFFEARIRQRSDLARQWFDQIQETILIEEHTLLRAEAALLLAEGNTEAAEGKAQKGLALAQRDRLEPGFALVEQERFQSLLQDIASAS